MKNFRFDAIGNYLGTTGTRDLIVSVSSIPVKIKSISSINGRSCFDQLATASS